MNDSLALASGSGSGSGSKFSIVHEGGTTTVTLGNEETMLVRSLADHHGRGFRDVVEFVRSVALAVEFDEEEGDIESAFAAPAYFDEALGLNSRFSLVGESNLRLQARFTVCAHEDDRLDYDNFGVRFDLSLTELLQRSELAWKAIEDRVHLS